MSNYPNPIPSSRDNTKGFIFLGAEDGYVYKLQVPDQSQPGPLTTVAQVDTRRPSCSFDKVVATPAVQLYSYANGAFRSKVDSFGATHIADDVVFVMTSTSCGDVSHNRIIAYFASDMTKMWEFNAPLLPGQEAGPIRVGQGTEGCNIDYVHNRLYCGTYAPPGSDQDSLWALDTTTGRLVWSDNPGGSVLNRPMLNGLPATRLYVVSDAGSLWAYDPAGNGLGGPAKRWASGLSVASPGTVVTRSPALQPQPGGWQNKILVLDSGGTLRAVQDNGISGSVMWAIEAPGTARWVSAPLVMPGGPPTYAFLGRDDGYLQQIDLDTGQAQGIVQIASTTTENVFDPVLDSDPGGVGLALLVVGGTKIARVTVPICSDEQPPIPFACKDECYLPGQQANCPTPDWNPDCGTSCCSSQSCRNPRNNLQYNPCQALDTSTSACINDTYPACGPGGAACTHQGNVPDGTACDDGWSRSPWPFNDRGASTCRADAIPAFVACTLAEGTDCDPATGAYAPGFRSKCVTKPDVCGAVGGGKCCVCNDGFGMNCNDRCSQGICVSDRSWGCPVAGAGSPSDSPCINAGDRACAAGQTCCGSNKGSACATDADCSSGPQGACRALSQGGPKNCYYQKCADLADDPQHCGSCGNDCGEYTIADLVCSDDLGCGACHTDADCAALGAGKCVDGTCGKCHGDTRVSGPSCIQPCTSDAQCGLGVCTNGYCCAAGSECVGGACLPLVCHRLTNRGVCTGGVCTVGAPCTGPSAADVASANLSGMCSLGFEFTTESDGSSRCRAYSTNYRSDGGARLAAIDALGAVTGYTASPTDGTQLNGVAVSRDGRDLFAAFSSHIGGVPGLAFRGPGSLTYGRIKTVLSTGGVDDNPFDSVAFNRGPVGPAFDWQTFTNDDSRRLWLGNFKCPAAPTDGPCTCVDLDLCRIAVTGSTWSATPEPYCNLACADGDGRCEYFGSCPPPVPERITALALAPQPTLFSGARHRQIFVAHGTTLSFVDLDGGTPRQSDVNLASPAVRVSDPARGESTVEAILSIAPTPYGDLLVEVRGAGDKPAPGNARNAWLINISAGDLSVRDELDVQRSLKHVNPCGAADSCEPGYACVDKVCLQACSGACPTGFTCASTPPFGNLCRINGEVPPNFGVAAGVNGGNGRLSVMPSGKLLRWVALASTPPANVTLYETTRTPACSDGNPCTTDSFNPATGLCEYAPVSCSDPDLCTLDSCDQATGQCVHAPVSCSDSDLCTLDSCDPGTGQCAHAPVNCDDNNGCTADSCNPASGCVHSTIVLTEPSPVQFATGTSVQWPPTADATEWNTYRGTIPANMLGSRPPGTVWDQVCYESADAFADGPTVSTDASNPPLGTGYYYLVTGEAGCESTLGHASDGKVIPNNSPCPTPP